MVESIVIREKTTGLPEEDAMVLGRYAMWNPQAKVGILCSPCSHCSPNEGEGARQRMLRTLHGECHCHPCGSIVPDRRSGQN